MIYGILEDNITQITSSWIIIESKQYSEFVFFYLFEIISRYLNSIFIYNSLLLMLFLINFLICYIFFRRFFNKIISFTLTIIFTFSSYTLYKSQNHIVLLNVWILLLYLILSFKLEKKNVIKIFLIIYGIAFGITTLISNYLAFFGLLFSVIFLGINYLFQLYKSKFDLKLLKEIILKLSILYISVLIPILLVNYNFIQANFLSDSSSADSSFVLKRSIDDFFIFSSRPWYYFLPSVDNPFYGEYSKNILNYLENDWGSFLAKNYFKSEHSASYLGIINFILAILGVFYLRRNKDKIENYTQIVILGITGIVLVLFTMPPYLEFGSFRFYFPSYLIAEFFPMFRVLARLGILILIIQLVFTGYGYIHLFEKFKNFGFKNIYSYFIGFLLVTVSISEFFIPFKLTDISQIPDVYNYLKSNSTAGDSIAILPRGKSGEGLFWSKDHKLVLVNLERDHFYNSKKISKDEFYNRVVFTCEGLEILKNYNTRYLVYFYNVDSNYESKIYFLSKNLEIVEEFKGISQADRYGNKFYTVINTGNNITNQAILFRINDSLICESK